MVWSHNESWMVTGDHAGYVKYWQSNMNNVKMFQAHKEAIRGLRYSIYHSSPYIYRETVPRGKLTCVAARVQDVDSILVCFSFCIALDIELRIIVWIHR